MTYLEQTAPVSRLLQVNWSHEPNFLAWSMGVFLFSARYRTQQAFRQQLPTVNVRNSEYSSARSFTLRQDSHRRMRDQENPVQRQVESTITELPRLLLIWSAPDHVASLYYKREALGVMNRGSQGRSIPWGWKDAPYTLLVTCPYHSIVKGSLCAQRTLQKMSYHYTLRTSLIRTFFRSWLSYRWFRSW